MANVSASFRLAQAIGLTSAAWLSGNIAALSLISVPALTKTQDVVPPTTLAKQWRCVFEAGKSQNPPVAAAAAVSFSYLAWTLRSRHVRNSRLYGLAAILTIGIVPYTLVAMNATNQKLLVKAEEKVGAKDVVKDEEVGALLRKWTTLNGVRSMLPLVGTAAGFLAMLL